MKIIYLKDAITGKLRQDNIDHNKIVNFREQLRIYLKKIDEYNHEDSEEIYQRDFLNNTFYSNYDICKPDDNNTDFAIRRTEMADSPISVIIENKTKENDNEMVSKDNLNCKGMQELVYYYLIERVENNNTDICHLIVTNMYEYYIFDGDDFDHYFYKNHELRRKFIDFREQNRNSKGKTWKKRTTDFYEIAGTYIEQVQEDLPFVYVEVGSSRFRTLAKSKNETDLKSLSSLYKLFSDTYMMKKPSQDRNGLNKGFYAELLYILGLREKKDEKKKKLVIERLDESITGKASLMDLVEKNVRENLPLREGYEMYGDTLDEQVYEVSLEICITWVNRLLFLKLLESQLIKYHKGDSYYKILDWEKIKSFHSLYSLFFDILAVDYDKRDNKYIQESLRFVPYLNSSLFERTKEEIDLCEINALPDDRQLPIKRDSILYKQDKKFSKSSLPTLQYIFAFLDSYDFSSQGNGEIVDSSRSLINASVLGKIFEKINGYKDGAVFTPANITTTMAHQAVLQTVINKFNEVRHWSCKNQEELDFKIQKELGSDLKSANEIFNSIKIADISVGSGHFLVSVLNELILLKFKLQILIAQDGTFISKWRYRIDIEDDELVILNDQGNYIYYDPENDESQRIQKTIFNEKQKLIEKCLFGVDINPSSVNICRLRLWIELLKNTYYTEESGFEHLSTLPNLDINIKQGDSLISRFPIRVTLTKAKNVTQKVINNYHELTRQYKRTADKAVKHEIDKEIDKIKDTIKAELIAQSPQYALWIKKKQEWGKYSSTILDFGGEQIESKAYLKRKEKAKKEFEQAKAELDELRNGTKYVSAFEWSFEFPEILDNNTKYVGFDLIIGNPPYIQLQKAQGRLGTLYAKSGYFTYEKSGDICCLFYERGIDLLKPGGLLCYITSNKWMRAGYGSKIRNYFVHNVNTEKAFDFGGYKVFDGVNIDTVIMLIRKEANKHNLLGVRAKSDFNKDSSITDYFKANAIKCDFKGDEIWTFVHDNVKAIKSYVEQQGKHLIEWGIEINNGIKTGYNPAFYVNEEQRNAILDACQTDDERERTGRIIRPMLRGKDIVSYGTRWKTTRLYLINTHNSVKIKDNHNRVKVIVDRIKVEEYPAIKEHLDKYIAKLKNRTDKGETPYNLRSCEYLLEFDKPKIIYPNMTKFLPFYYDAEKHFLANQKCYIITGRHLAYLTAFFNSSLFKFCFIDNFTTLGEDRRELNKNYFERIPVKDVDDETNAEFETLVNDIQSEYTEEKAKAIDERIFDIYNLSKEDRSTIGFIDFHDKK